MKNIVIISGDREVNQELRDCFQEIGCAVTIFDNRIEVLNYVMKKQVDLAVVDTDIENIKLHSLLISIKSFYPELPIIILAGEIDYEEEKKIRICGVNFYSKKPLVIAEIKKVAQFILALERKGLAFEKTLKL